MEAGVDVDDLARGREAEVRAQPQGGAGDAFHAWRAEGGTLKRVALQVGERDARTGERPVVSGLAAGDRILRHPVGTLADGQAFELAKPATSAAASAAK